MLILERITLNLDYSITGHCPSKQVVHQFSFWSLIRWCTSIADQENNSNLFDTVLAQTVHGAKLNFTNGVIKCAKLKNNCCKSMKQSV